jgi:hypothetical protein
MDLSMKNSGQFGPLFQGRAAFAAAVIAQQHLAKHEKPL